ncbi:MAG TPA: hypothetical protein PKK06_04610 [Phycisphaerae bacterium]|nr:hypothetical protein [Phycisphaerae bacterium]HNU45121.1 hypothetical protein [Phycisphaerae bacterium]
MRVTRGVAGGDASGAVTSARPVNVDSSAPSGGSTAGDARVAVQDKPPVLEPATAAAAPAKPSAAGPHAGCGDVSPPSKEEEAAQASNASEPPPAAGQPRFACARPNVRLDPVWQGAKAEFPFEIRNEGTGDLQVNLKGG